MRRFIYNDKRHRGNLLTRRRYEPFDKIKFNEIKQTKPDFIYQKITSLKD